jgi:predicted flap endonuclease-1-like 5' DNA nuclease
MASIAAIPGLHHGQATKLRKARVRTTEALLKSACSRKGRRELADLTGLDEKQILEWVNRADLMRVRGIGSEYADLLEAAGVDTIKELRRRNPSNLLEAMADLNLRKRLVRRLPTESMVVGWVDSAKTTQPMVGH